MQVGDRAPSIYVLHDVSACVCAYVSVQDTLHACDSSSGLTAVAYKSHFILTNIAPFWKKKKADILCCQCNRIHGTSQAYSSAVTTNLWLCQKFTDHHSASSSISDAGVSFCWVTSVRHGCLTTSVPPVVSVFLMPTLASCSHGNTACACHEMYCVHS